MRNRNGSVAVFMSVNFVKNNAKNDIEENNTMPNELIISENEFNALIKRVSQM